MMANRRDIIVILLVTTFVILAITFFVGSRKGDLNLTAYNNDSADTIEVPRAPSEEPVAELVDDNALDVTSMETQNVVLKTNRGEITIELFTGAMPITTENFLSLARTGFYDGTKFHRVIDGFMIQGGDPNSKGDDTSTYGQGGPEENVEDEFVKGDLLTNVRGTIAMANTGQPNSGGSQFFINLANNTFLDFDKEPLTSKHPVFGRVVAGMDIVDQIAKVDTGARDIPLEPIVIESIVIE